MLTRPIFTIAHRILSLQTIAARLPDRSKRRLYERLRGGPWAMWAGDVAQAIKLIEERQQH